MDVLTRAYLALSLTPGLGARRIKLLSEHFGDAEAVCNASLSELRSAPGIGPKLAEAIVTARASEMPEKEIARAERLGVALLPFSHSGYPESLRAIYDPPPVLYVRGELPQAVLAGRALGIVGTRDASPYGLEISRQLAAELAQAGVAIISGLALGVDSAAHQGAISAQDGCTVAVFGSGVDVIYPRQNQTLAKRILAGRGALVSDYLIGSGPKAENFPGRNRIINGLSAGVVVVEAGSKSGALITAEYALEEGRTVFAVPGRAGDPKAKGVLALLKQGAVLAASAADILSELGWGQSEGREDRLGGLEPPLQDVAKTVQQLGSPLLDDLIGATGKQPAELLPLLTLLELKGVVKTLPGGRYLCL
jgi:DNA processing protein